MCQIPSEWSLNEISDLQGVKGQVAGKTIQNQTSHLSASEVPQPLLFQLCYWSPHPERENVRVSKWIQESLDLWAPQALLWEVYFLSSVGCVLPHLTSVLVLYMRTNHVNFHLRAHPRPSCIASPPRHTWHLVQRGHSGNRRLLQTCMRVVLSLAGNARENTEDKSPRQYTRKVQMQEDSLFSSS